MIILALDCATKTGWAVFIDGKLMESGVKAFTKRRGETNGMMFLKFRKWLGEFYKLYTPDLIIYEQASHRGGAATEICSNLTGRAQEIAADWDINCTSVRPSELKKYATGKGNAGKTEMMRASERLLGRTPIDDNEADAVLIGAWAVEEFGA